jgi:hypothetical protein
VAASRRSIHPGLPGLPWWAVVVVAITTTTVGIAFDAGSGNKELTNSFAAMYVLGCVTAVLTVRQSGVFTAVIQPPLILFCAVPGAYWLFHGATFTDIKGIIINCGYPLIERFPLMLFTSAGVLLIGMSRWFFAMAAPAATSQAGAEATASSRRMPSVAEKLATKFAAMLDRRPAHVTGAAPSHRRRPADRPGRSTARSRGSGSARRFAPTSSRHVRPQFNDIPDPRFERPRRRRPAPERHEEPPLRRRPKPAQDSNRRRQTEARHSQAARKVRRDPRLEPPPRRQQATTATNGADATHHPISQVRYRSPDSSEHGSRKAGAESWEYDI